MRFPATPRAIPKTCARSLAALAIVFTLACLPSCNTPDSVAAFCSSAVATLKSGDAVFDDMKASCIREAQTRERFDTFSLSDATPAVCEDIGKQAEGLKAVSRILADYFSALNDLAAFGKAKAADESDEGNGKAASDTGEAAKASASAKLTGARQKALESVAGFLAKVVSSGYQQKHLADDIVKVHGDVKAVLDGLGEAAGAIYLDQLQDEEEKTVTRYKAFLLEHPDDAAAILALDTRWQADRATFAAKRKAALSFKAALETVARGDDALAAHARGPAARDLAALLSPYAAQLQSLVPAIQKAFF